MSATLDSKITAAFSKLESSGDFVSFELTPLVGAQVLAQDTLDELRDCTLFDSFVCTDSPLARFKPSSVLSSIALQNALQTPLICTLSMRDRNTTALCGEILGANAFGLRAFLSLTGDPTKLGNTDSKAVFEDNSTRLNAIINALNAGLDLTGNTLKSTPKRIYNCNVINSYAINTKTIESKMIKKIKSTKVDSSCALSAFFSQPVYSIESAHTLLDSLESANRTLGTKVSLVLGFFPVVSYKSAVFLRDKMPGVFIPESWILRLEKAHKSHDPKAEEQKVGLDLSRELFYSLRKIHNKFHFMTNNNLPLARQILL
ncbi:methylenetetrahydrofolate reductase [Helicobacter sp. XJK30-2]|uniref:Methylenetetrahydrofolate reductase n=1 Tax=Helicobacter zhangjianzhongii TaxID=2974574 RepID=A0ACC6FTS9_9HELI|nr:methylenetetrahydrofolate reductase [Helicobacter sp. XJK30-2]MDL0082343.1 methylenetetrahydrofolate reductase [Helicobacter sp. XJK30-2]